MSVLILGAVVVGHMQSDVPAPTGRWAASTPQLAAELLPPELAADAVSHYISRDLHLLSKAIGEGSPPFAVRFDGRARRSNDGFCARKTYYVSDFRETVDGGVVATNRYVGDKVRIGGCEGKFAYLNPGASLEDGKRVLRWLEWAVRTAKSRKPLPFKVSCSDEMPYDDDRCASGARGALAALPLDKVTIMTNKFDARGHRWTVSVADARVGDTYWEVKVDGTPNASSIDLTWRIPPVF